jgi:hypothetical protein
VFNNDFRRAFKKILFKWFSLSHCYKYLVNNLSIFRLWLTRSQVIHFWYISEDLFRIQVLVPLLVLTSVRQLKIVPYFTRTYE